MEQRPIAFIPARGGSRRVKNKNLVDLGGRPLLAHTIDTARDSGVFGDVFVNSDSGEILDAAARFGGIPDSRPAHLAADEVRIIHVLQEFIERRSIQPQTVIGILLVTCPLRHLEDIRKAYALFGEKENKVPVASVTPFERPIEVAQRMTEDNRLTPVFSEEYLRTTRSQDHETAFWYNGAIIFNTAGQLVEQDTLIGHAPIAYQMPFERSFDIDHDFQVRVVELFFKEHGRGDQ